MHIKKIHFPTSLAAATLLCGALLGSVGRGLLCRKKELTTKQDHQLGEHFVITFFEALGDGVLLEREDGSIIDANSRACELFKMTKEQILASKAENLRGKTEHALPVDTGHESPFTFPIETTITRNDGTAMMIESSSVSYEVDGEKHNISIVRDITEQRRLSQEVERSKQAAKETDTAQKKFLLAVSHQIRTPLNGITGMTDLLRATTPLTSEQRKLLDDLAVSCEALSSAVQGILYLTKNEPDELTPPPTPAAAAQQLAVAWTTPPSILLAEDNEVSRKVAQLKLESLGCRVTFALNGEEAVKLCTRDVFDLIIMDVQMPMLDGIEAAQEIRKIQPGALPMGDGSTPVASSVESLNQQTPIIALTAHSFPEEQHRCLAAGMTDFVAKPFKTKNLLDTLRKHLPHLLTTKDQQTATEDDQAASHSAVIPPPFFDQNAMMENFDNDLAAFKSVAGIFLAQIPELLSDMRFALENGVLKNYKDQAHTLKGVAAQLGAERLRVDAKTAEESAVRGDDAMMRSLLDTLAADFEELKRHLHEKFSL